MKRDIHGYKKRFESAVRAIQSSKEISERNRKLILDFLSRCQIDNLSIGRIARYAYTMFKIAKWLGKDFDTATREDIERVVGIIQSNDEFKDWTKHLYKVSIKKFYKVLNGGEEYRKEVKWIKCNFRNSDRILPEDLLTHEEVKKMIETAEHPRDKAFIAVLYDGGFRIGEIASLRMKDVVADEYGAQVIVDGKTGMRRVRLIASAPYLLEWLN